VTKRPLPAPRLESDRSVEFAIATRRTRRTFLPEPLTEAQVAQLLWSAQGITDAGGGLRAAPSAMESYPLELYVATGEGVWHYLPSAHALEQRSRQDIRPSIRAGAHDQESITSAPVVFLFSAVYARAAAKLGPGSEPFVHMDLGHAAQNLLLQATALDLAGVPIAWLEAELIRTAFDLPEELVPLYLVPVGRPA
jgi:SagB-type dehydrogenase family enzyme